jgi:hypothetical protein
MDSVILSPLFMISPIERRSRKSFATKGRMYVSYFFDEGVRGGARDYYIAQANGV